MAMSKKLASSPVVEVANSLEPMKAKAGKAATPAKVSSPLAAIRAHVKKSLEQNDVKEHLGPIPSVTSGSMCIDDLIGGTLAADKSGPKCPGYPRKHITEIYGAESSGKTTAAIQAAAAVQAEGGSVMFIDFEHALDHQYAKRVGMSFDEDKLVLYQPDTMEQGWQIIHIGIAAGVDLIIVDSVAAMVPEAELEKKAGDPPKIGAVAASMSRNLPKICAWLNSPKYTRNPKGTALVMLNQIRAAISTGGGPGQGTNENTTGGHAMKFYAYLRIKFTKIRTERLSGKKRDGMTGKEVSLPYGNLTQVKLVKSKVDGKQGFTTEIFIRFNYGIDDYYSLIEAGVSTKLVKKSGSSFTYGGQSFQGREKMRRFFMDNPKQFAELRAKILKAVRDDSFEEDPTPEDDDLLLFDTEEEDSKDTPAEEVLVEEVGDN